MTERTELVIGPPDDWTEIALGMTNFDHSIDDGFDEALRVGDVFGRHAAWNFNGRVWFCNGQFHEQVWCYHVPRQTFSADSLRDLMEIVNDAYGWQ